MKMMGKLRTILRKMTTKNPEKWQKSVPKKSDVFGTGYELLEVY